MNGDPKTVDGTCGENLSMESEQEAEIQALKYRIDDLESDLRDLKVAFRYEVDDRKDLDYQLSVSKTKIESLTQNLVESNQKLKRSLEALDRLYREGFKKGPLAEANSVLKDNGY